ncbi:MAG TPA: NAD(P)-dependent oxidoreductase [Thermoplasmata archaeon]|nr:NAD(P)-dependent oxidoreductase [Thermoplasmata archaeon]
MSASSAPLPAPVGLIGLGRMGAPIAGRLLDRGFALTVYNRSAAKADAAVARGARPADAPRAVGAAVADGVLLTLLTDARAVRAVLFGRRGAAAGLRPGALVVDLSTIAPDESRSIAERLAGRGIDFVDAPLGGSTDAAAAGELLVYAGGTPPAVDRARPVLGAFARRVERLGPVGAGSSMKLVNNFLTIGHVALAGEALALAEALGLERERTLDLLLDGGANSRMLAAKRAQFGRREYPTRFALALAAKDLGLVGRAARSVGGTIPVLRELRRTAAEAIRAGHGDDDFAAMFEASRARFGRATPSAPAAAGT